MGYKGESGEPLYEAALNDDVEKLRLLVQMGTDVNVCDFDGRTALHKAAAAGKLRAVQFLVQRGAKILCKDRWGQVPLQYAKENRHVDIAHFLEHSFALDSPLKRSRTLPSMVNWSSFTGGILSPVMTPKLTSKLRRDIPSPEFVRPLPVQKIQKSDKGRDAQAQKIEQLTQNEIQSRLLFTSHESRSDKSKLYEAFFVVGATKKESPAVVFRYPENSMMDLSGIADFCFPAGLDSPLIPRTTQVNANNIPMSKSPKVTRNDPPCNPPQVIHINNAQNSFVFLLTNKFGETLYCTCVVDDVLKIKPPFIKKLSRRRNQVLCYCAVTKYPLVQPFFKFLYSILDVIFYGQMINQTPDNGDTGKQILELLADTYKQDIPAPGQLLRLINCKVPMPFPNEAQQYLTQYCGQVLFQCFSEKKMLWLLSAILCEKSVLFISSSTRKLSSVVISFIPLIFPLTYVSSLIPILPNKLLSIIDAPVPYVVGMMSSAPIDEHHSLPPDLIVVDLEAPNAYHEIPTQPHVPELPNQEKLLESLPYFYRNKQLNTLADGEVSPIFGHINTYISSSLLTLQKYCITDLSNDVTVFWSDTFIEEQPERHVPFFRAFMETQMFRTYMDKRLRDYDNKRRSSTPQKIRGSGQSVKVH